jgi:hypothetical protein
MVGNQMLRGVSGGQRKRVTTGEVSLSSHAISESLSISRLCEQQSCLRAHWLLQAGDCAKLWLLWCVRALLDMLLCLCACLCS